MERSAAMGKGILISVRGGGEGRFLFREHVRKRPIPPTGISRGKKGKLRHASMRSKSRRGTGGQTIEGDVQKKLPLMK